MKLLMAMPFDRGAAGLTSANGADDMIGFTAILAFNNMRRFLVGRIEAFAVFLHCRRRFLFSVVCGRRFFWCRHSCRGNHTANFANDVFEELTDDECNDAKNRNKAPKVGDFWVELM